MRKRTFLLLVVIAFTVVAVLGGITAESKSKKSDQQDCADMGAGMMPGAGLAFLLKNSDFQKQLGITDDQMTKIQNITNEYQTGSAPGGATAATAAIPANASSAAAIPTNDNLRDKIKTARQDLDQLVGSDNPDLAKVDAKIDDISRNAELMQKNDVHLMISVNSVLTADQRAKLKQMIQQAMQPKKSEAKNNNSGGMSGGHGHWGGGGMGRPGGGVWH